MKFKTITSSQRSFVATWLNQDYIKKWVHGQGLENLFNGLEKFIAYQENGGKINREMELTQHWVGYENNKPFVYLLTSNVNKNISDVYSLHSLREGSAITLDIFIIDPEYIGKGLGTKIIKEFLLTHFSDVTEVFIDPEQSNTRAAHVYQKVGFEIVGEFNAAWHPVPHYVMRLFVEDIKNNSGEI